MTLLRPDEVVEDGDGEEVGPYSTLERSCDLDHPVDHLRAVLLADVVGVERRHGRLWVGGHQVLVDLLVEG